MLPGPLLSSMCSKSFSTTPFSGRGLCSATRSLNRGRTMTTMNTLWCECTTMNQQQTVAVFEFQAHSQSYIYLASMHNKMLQTIIFGKNRVLFKIPLHHFQRVHHFDNLWTKHRNDHLHFLDHPKTNHAKEQ